MMPSTMATYPAVDISCPRSPSPGPQPTIMKAMAAHRNATRTASTIQAPTCRGLAAFMDGVAVGKGLARSARPASTGFRDGSRESAKRAYTIAAPPAIRRSALARLAPQCQAQHDLERHDADREKGQHGLEPDRHFRRRPRPGAEDAEPERCRQAGAEDESQGNLLKNGLVHRFTSLRAAV